MVWEIGIKGDEDVLLALSRTNKIKEEGYVLEDRDGKFVLSGRAFYGHFGSQGIGGRSNKEMAFRTLDTFSNFCSG